MGGAWRIEYEGALYHLGSRGNNGQDIYLNDADRNLFLETISEMSERFKMDIFAYVLISLTTCSLVSPCKPFNGTSKDFLIEMSL